MRTYSVFVGHLVQSVTKEELYTLFQGCGDIADIFVSEDKKRTSDYKYGFVRFEKADQALKAVEELHRWPLHGTKIIVDIASDTIDMIKAEKKLNNDRISQSSQITEASCPVRKVDGTGSKALVQDIMYLSRIKETCASLNCQVNRGLVGDGKSRTVNVDSLIDKISAKSLTRIKPIHGEFQYEITPEHIRDTLLERDTFNGSVDNGRAAGFIKALQKVVTTLNTFLQEGHQEPEINEATSLSHLLNPSSSNLEKLKPTLEALEEKRTMTVNEAYYEQKATNMFTEDADELTDNSSGSPAAFKQFYFQASRKDYAAEKDSVRKNFMSEKMLEERGDMKLPGATAMEEIEDNSNTDSDCEGPSRDSGIESDPVSVKFQNRAPEQSPVKIEESDVPKPPDDNLEPVFPMLKEGPVEKEKMDDCAIIEAFLQKSLKLGDHKVQDDTSEIPAVSPEPGNVVSLLSLGRGTGRGIIRTLQK